MLAWGGGGRWRRRGPRAPGPGRRAAAARPPPPSPAAGAAKRRRRPRASSSLLSSVGGSSGGVASSLFPRPPRSVRQREACLCCVRDGVLCYMERSPCVACARSSGRARCGWSGRWLALLGWVICWGGVWCGLSKHHAFFLFSLHRGIRNPNGLVVLGCWP